MTKSMNGPVVTAPSEMRAALLGEQGRIRVRSVRVPTVGADDVLVRVRRASLCGTDVKILERKFFPDGGPAPDTFIPGHEYAGEVVAVGDSVDEFAVGDRVVTEAHRGCMRCSNCLSGQYTDCLNYGDSDKGHRTYGMTIDGGFADYVANHVSTLHHLPDQVGFDGGVILTTVGTVMHAFDVLGSLLVGAHVAVIGPGPIGLLAVQVARELGAASVALVGTRQSRLELGSAFGADVVVHADDNGRIEKIKAAADGWGADVVLECSGAGPAVDDALAMVRRGGRIVLVGFFGEPVTADLNRAVVNGVTLHTVRGEGSGSLARGIALAARDRLDLDSLVTHHFPLEEIQDAFAAYNERRDDAIKVMLDVSDPDSSSGDRW